MKLFKYLSLVLVVVLAVSCEKHEIEYMSTPLADDMAEFQLHYMVPNTSSVSNNIYQVLINDSLISNATAPLTVYSYIPKGSVGHFYTVKPGSVNIKLFKSITTTTPATLSLVYDQNVTLTKGKQNVVVHSLTEAPKVLGHGFPFIANTTLDTDTISYVKFYNFMYESAGVPTPLKLQYQYIDTYKKEKVVVDTEGNVIIDSHGKDSTIIVTYIDTLNIGQPVAFGETTDWQEVIVRKVDYNSAGSQTKYFCLKTIDAEGNVIGELQQMHTNGLYRNYTDYWILAIGRRYLHMLAGYRTVKSPNATVKVTTAL